MVMVVVVVVVVVVMATMMLLYEDQFKSNTIFMHGQLSDKIFLVFMSGESQMYKKQHQCAGFSLY
jgi:hypothetical protein